MEYVKLGEVATFINGYAFKPSDWKKEGIPIIRIQNLTGNNREINYYQGKIDEKYHVKKGEILISWSASIDVYEWKGKNGYLNQHIFKVVFDKMDIDKDFFVYLIKNKLNEIKKYTHGSTMKHITKSKFDNIKIRIPSKEEQIKIANKLNKIIIIIEKQKEQLELLENLKKSQFFEMFGDPIKNEKGWKIKRLENILEINNKRKLLDSKKEYWLLNLEDIEQDSGRVILKKKVNYEKLPASISYFDKNWVLYSKLRPYLNKVVLSDEEGFCTSELLALKPNTKYITEIFLWKYLMNNSVLKYLETHVSGAKMPRVVINDFKNLKIILPPLELQNKFATKIEAIQKLKFRKLKSIEKLKSQKIYKNF